MAALLARCYAPAMFNLHGVIGIAGLLTAAPPALAENLDRDAGYIYQDLPSPIGVPAPGYELAGAVLVDEPAIVRRHAWDLWTGSTAPSDSVVPMAGTRANCMNCHRCATNPAFDDRAPASANFGHVYNDGYRSPNDPYLDKLIKTEFMWLIALKNVVP